MQQSFANWWRRTPAWLGLSVDAQSMTLVEWPHPTEVQYPGQRWVQEEWPQVDGLALGVLNDPANLGAAVQTLWQRSGMRCRRLAMGLPADKVVQNTLQIDVGLPAREVRAQVNWSASQALDLAWDAVAFDYRVENPADVSLHARDTLTVNWRACPMALVQAAQQMSRSARLRLQFLGIEPADTPPLKNWPGNTKGDATGNTTGDSPNHGAELSPQLHRACEMARQGAMA